MNGITPAPAAANNAASATSAPPAKTAQSAYSSDDAQLAAFKKSVADLDLKATAISRGGQADAPGGWWSTHSAMTMSATVLIFGAVVIALASIRVKGDTTNEEALRLYGTIMVITMAVFLVVAGYDDKQIAAPLGLLGTIVGYLLGRGAKPAEVTK